MNIDFQTPAERFQRGYRDAFLDPGLRRARNELFKSQAHDIKLQRALDEGRLGALHDQKCRMQLRKELARMRIPSSPPW
jgi:hypothetical protein